MYELRKINIPALQSMQKVPIDHIRNRCVQQFDHHCMWINNCVGSKNYKQFLAMIILTFLNMAVYVIGVILLWTEYSYSEYLGEMIALWIFAFIIAIFTILLINLIGLHFYLIYRGITTYQFIMLQRQQQRLKKQQQTKAQTQQMIKNRQNTIVPVQIKSNNGQNHSKGSDEQRNPKINEVQFKNQSHYKSHQNSDVIFGGHVHQNQNRTEKSENIQEIMNKQNNIKIHIQEGQEENQNQINDQPSPLSSKRGNKSSLSQFFTKNKSLKFFIGDQIGSRPRSSRNPKQNPSMHLFNSLRFVKDNQNQKNAVYTSQVRQNNSQVRHRQVKNSVQNNNIFQQSKQIKSFKMINLDDNINRKSSI